MQRAQLQILEDLVMIPSPSGFEKAIARYIMDSLKDLPVEITKDRQHNVSAIIKGLSDKVVMVDAHMDQLGFVVHNIDKWGFISISQLGWGDTQIISARNLIILGEKKRINAVVNREHSHLVRDEMEHCIEETNKAIIDTGPRDGNEVKKYVTVGDPVVYRLSFNNMLKYYCSACGLDDKVGCWTLMQVIRRIAKGRTKPVPTLVFTFSAQEESCSKWAPLIRKHKPELFIEVDTAMATDWHWDDYLPYNSGTCNLGGGPIIYRGAGVDKAYQQLLKKTADDMSIATQILAENDPEPGIHNARIGTTVVYLAIPCRNMHTPVETVNTLDMDYTAKLLHKFLLSRKMLTI